MKGANAVELALLLAFEGISFGRRLRIGLEIDRQDAPFTRSLRTFAEILAGLAMAGAVASLSQT